MSLDIIKTEGHCYVLLCGDWIHPHAPLMREYMLWYPERAMTLFDQYTYRPYVKSIVTENPWLITLYDREKVRIVYDDGSWQLPQYQTYGAGFEHMVHNVLNIPSSVAAMVLDGGKQFKKVVSEYKKRVDKAHKLYNVST